MQHPKAPPGDDGRLAATPNTRRRRLPSQHEQDRRREWGKRWGKINSELAAKLREGWG